MNYNLGKVSIEVQNELHMNEDYYTITIPSELRIKNVEELWNGIVSKIEDPERLVLGHDGGALNVYSRQPDAVLELAALLNQMVGADVAENEIESLRSTLIDLQAEEYSPD